MAVHSTADRPVRALSPALTHDRAAHVLSAGNDVEATSAAIGIGMKLSREEVLRGLAEVGYVAELQLPAAE
jgi:hypothetical protein